MACGASISDAALLVISAKPGEFEYAISKNGMTRQEALMAYSSGVRQFIIVINKMDIVDYSEFRYNEVKNEVSNYLKKLGVASNRQIFIPLSGYNGDNLVEKSNNMPWYNGWECSIEKNSEIIKGYTLIDAVDYGLIIPRRAIEKPLRIPILRTYKVKGIGTVATGRIATGTLNIGDNLIVNPIGKSAKAFSIESYHKGKSQAIPGDIIGVQLPKISVNDVPRGAVLSLSTSPSIAVRCFIARVIITNLPNVLKKGFTPYFYCHTSSFPATFIELIDLLDKKTGSVIENNPTCLKQGSIATVKIVTQKAVVVEPFRICPPLGRFVIKNSCELIGVGQIVEVFEKDPNESSISKKNIHKSKYFRR